MASTRTTKLQRFLIKCFPFMFKKCPAGNYHWRWDDLCWCRYQEHCGDWHGGIYHFRTGFEFWLYDDVRRRILEKEKSESKKWVRIK